MAMKEAQLPGVWQDFLRSQRPVIIYGAGRQATVVYDFCKMYRKKIHLSCDNQQSGTLGHAPA